MNWRRYAISVALAAVWSLAAGDPAGGADRDCKEARKHFRKSVWWFETDKWDKAVDEALLAISKARGCDEDELSFVVPYGRWVYSFNPEVYLGVAVANSTRCDGKEAVEERMCSIDVPLWEAREACEQDHLAGDPETCREHDQGRLRCGPEVEWWLQLGGSGVEVGLNPSAETQNLLSMIRAPGRPPLTPDCAALWGVAPFLVEAILRKGNPNRAACEALLRELTAVLEATRGSCDQAG